MFPHGRHLRPGARAAARRAGPRGGDPAHLPGAARTRSRWWSRRSSVPRPGLARVRALIWVESESQKGIVVGAQRADDQGDRHRRAAGARARARTARSTSTCRCACAATGAPTRACSTGSASADASRRLQPTLEMLGDRLDRCERRGRRSTRTARPPRRSATAQAGELVVLEARPLVHGERRAGGRVTDAPHRRRLPLAPAERRGRLAVEARDPGQLGAREAPRQQAVDDHPRRARGRAARAGPPAARASRSPPSRSPARPPGRSCGPGRPAARPPARPGRRSGPTRAIAPNVCGERSIPSACPVAGASRTTRS